MGILYSEPDSFVSPNIEPEYSIRYVSKRPRRPRRRNAIHMQLPPFLTSSILSENPSIARLMAWPNTTSEPVLHETIQHRSSTVPTTPQSLPPPLSESISSTVSSDSSLASTSLFPTIPISISPAQEDSTWEFLDSTPATPLVVSTPASELETWVILSDDS
jgi:hypothetical protein